MLQVVLDTCIFSADPGRRKTSFDVVKRLAIKGYLKLHVPHVVSQEFIAQQRVEYKQRNKEARDSLAAMRVLPLPDDIASRVNELLELLKQKQDWFDIYPEQEFHNWLVDVKASQRLIADTHGTRVMDDYFEGHLPFKEPKSREGIPDSFIWQDIVDLVKEVGNIFVITKDKYMLKACENTSGVIAYESLDKFIESDVCKPFITEVNVAENVAKLLRVLNTTETLLKASLMHFIDEGGLYGLEVRSHELPNESDEATVELVEITEGDLNIEFDMRKAHYLGEGTFVLGFDAAIPGQLSYFISKGDYYSLSEKRAEGIYTYDWNDHYFEAQETYPLVMKGRLVVKIELSQLQGVLVDEAAIKLLQDAQISVDSIDELEVDEVFFEHQAIMEIENGDTPSQGD